MMLKAILSAIFCSLWSAVPAAKLLAGADATKLWTSTASNGTAEGALKLESIEASVVEMAREGVTPALLPFISQIFELIGAIKSDVESQAQRSQAELNNSWEAFRDCSPDYDELFQNLSTWNKTHRDCRDLESELAEYYYQCIAACDVLNKTAKAACDAFGEVDEYPPLGHCVVSTTQISYDPLNITSSKDHYENLLRDFKSKYSMWQERKERCETLFAQAQNCYHSCDEASLTAWQQKKQECIEHQADLEQQACAGEVDCTKYDICYDQKKKAWLDTNATAGAEEIGFLTEYRGILRIQCLLKALSDSIHNQEYKQGGASPRFLEDRIKGCRDIDFRGDYLNGLRVHYFEEWQNQRQTCKDGIQNPFQAPGSRYWVSEYYADMPNLTHYASCSASCCSTQIDEDRLGTVLYTHTDNFPGLAVESPASKTPTAVLSGPPDTVSSVSWLGSVNISADNVLEIKYRYVVGAGCGSANGPTFKVYIGSTRVSLAQGPYDDYPYDSCLGSLQGRPGGCPTCYSPVLTLHVEMGTDMSGPLITRITNNNRSLYLQVVEIRKRPPQPTPAGYVLTRRNVAYCHSGTNNLKPGVSAKPDSYECCKFGWGSYSNKKIGEEGDCVDICDANPNCKYISRTIEGECTLTTECDPADLKEGSFYVYEKNSPTCGGTGHQQTCKFPFTYNNQQFTECTNVDHTQRWCAVSYLGDGTGVDRWGNCDCDSSMTVRAACSLSEVVKKIAWHGCECIVDYGFVYLDGSEWAAAEAGENEWNVGYSTPRGTVGSMNRGALGPRATCDGSIDLDVGEYIMEVKQYKAGGTCGASYGHGLDFITNKRSIQFRAEKWQSTDPATFATDASAQIYKLNITDASYKFHHGDFKAALECKRPNAVVSTGAEVVYTHASGFASVVVDGSAQKVADHVISGERESVTRATWISSINVTEGELVAITYKYTVGYGCPPLSGGPTFEVYIGNEALGAAQGPFNDYPYDACNGNGCSTCYSPEVRLRLRAEKAASGPLMTRFNNSHHNLHFQILSIEAWPYREGHGSYLYTHSRDFAFVSMDGIASREVSSILSGDQQTVSEVTWLPHVGVAAGMVIEFTYKYTVGLGCSENGSTGPSFEVYIGDMMVIPLQGPFSEYPHDACGGKGCPTCFSPEATIRTEIPSCGSGPLKTKFVNNDRNLYFQVVSVDILPSPVCTSRTLTTESPYSHGNLSKGLGQFNSLWSPDAVIRLEWNDVEYIEFKTHSNPFVDRTGYSIGEKDDNQLFSLTELTTSNAKLASWTQEEGAYLCLSSAAAFFTAWAIIPKNNTEFGAGCSSGNWQGRGAFYSEEQYGGGWVGVKDDGEPKSGKNISLGLTIKIECSGEPPGWIHVATVSNKNGTDAFSKSKDEWEATSTFGECFAFDGDGTPSLNQKRSCKAAAWNNVKSSKLRAVEFRNGIPGIREWTLDGEYTMNDLMRLSPNKIVSTSSSLILDPGTDEMAMAMKTTSSSLSVRSDILDGCMIQANDRGSCSSGLGCRLEAAPAQYQNVFCAGADSLERATEDDTVWLYMEDQCPPQKVITKVAWQGCGCIDTFGFKFQDGSYWSANGAAVDSMDRGGNPRSTCDGQASLQTNEYIQKIKQYRHNGGCKTYGHGMDFVTNLRTIKFRGERWKKTYPITLTARRSAQITGVRILKKDITGVGDCQRLSSLSALKASGFSVDGINRVFQPHHSGEYYEDGEYILYYDPGHSKFKIVESFKKDQVLGGGPTDGIAYTRCDVPITATCSGFFEWQPDVSGTWRWQPSNGTIVHVNASSTLLQTLAE